MTNWEKYFSTPERANQTLNDLGACLYRQEMGYLTCRECPLISEPFEECDKKQIEWLESRGGRMSVDVNAEFMVGWMVEYDDAVNYREMADYDFEQLDGIPGVGEGDGYEEQQREEERLV